MLIALLISIPMLAAPALCALGRRRDKLPDGCAMFAAALELALSLALIAFPTRLTIPGVLSGGLSFRADGFRVAYSVITSLLWLGTTIFSKEYFRREREGMAAYWFFVFLTLGAAQGVMLSADFLTTYVFFEILSLSSFPWVAHERTSEALRAARTYLAVAVIGGLILFMGLLLLQNEAGTLEYESLASALTGAERGRVFAAAVCILLGFGAKAGMFPLHVWLPKAHPVAPAPASALLSGLLTKVGVFGILMTALEALPRDRSFGLLVLTLGTITMVLGAVLALFSVNLKRTLACSSMSQIGFILVGIASLALNGSYGSENGMVLSLSGTVLHMVNHSLLKLVLFLCAGAVAMNLHALELNDIRGWGRNKPVLRLAFAAGALGISGVPLLNGYLSKTLLHEGLVRAAENAGGLSPLLRGAEALFLISGGLTFAYMLKLYCCVFREKNADPAKQDRYDAQKRCMTPLSSAVLLCGAASLLVLGQPRASTTLAAVMTGQAISRFAAFEWENLKSALISLSIGAAAYLGFVRPVLCPKGDYRNLWPDRLDLEDTVYRPLLLRVLPDGLGSLARCPGENVILKPLCRALALGVCVVCRVLDNSMDAAVLLLRRSALREEKVRDGRNLSRGGWMRTFVHATGETLAHVLDNFSFALMMTCIGIILILTILALLLR